MKFKVGDKVRVKSFKELKSILDKSSIMVADGKWLFSYEYPDGKKNELYFTEEMLYFCGQSAKIAVIEMGDRGRYKLEFDNKDFKNGRVFSFVEDWLEPFDNPIYVSSFDDKEENKSERLKVILGQIEQLVAEAHKIVEG